MLIVLPAAAKVAKLRGTDFGGKFYESPKARFASCLIKETLCCRMQVSGRGVMEQV